MSDIFREVEEDVRRERFEKLWKQYGDYVIAFAAALVIGIAGFKFWQRYEAQQLLGAASQYNATQQMAESGNGAAAAASFGKLARSAPGGYAQVAQLAEADALLSSGNRSDAVTLYKQIANKDNSPIANTARIRAAWAIVEFAPKAELQTLLAPLTDPTSAWRFMAREILAYADYRSGQVKAAQDEFASLAQEKDAPAAVRGRAGAMADLLKAGGDRNFGTVPLPQPPTAAAGTANGQTSP